MSYSRIEDKLHKDDIAKYLGCHRHTVENLIKKGELRDQSMQALIEYERVLAVKQERERIIAFLNT